MGLLCLAFRNLLCEFSVKALHAPCCIYKLVLAGKERVAVCANFDAKCVARRSGASLEFSRATGAMHGDGMVMRMDSLFHSFAFL